MLPLVPIAVVAAVGAGIGSYLAWDTNRRSALVSDLELSATTDDLRLDMRDLSAAAPGLGLTLLGGSPQLGRVTWFHETYRGGTRRLVVAKEVVRQGKSSREYTLVATTVPGDLSWFTNGGDEMGSLPDDVRTLLLGAVRDRVLRIAVVGKGLLVLRINLLTDTSRALALAADVAERLHDDEVARQTPASWQQPPRR